MFKSKKSQIVFSIFFIFCAYLVSDDFVVSYCQEKIESIVKEKQLFSEKPITIQLKPDKRIKKTVASDNEQQLFVTEMDGLIYSFDINSTEQLWSADLGGKTTSNLIENENFIYVVTTREIDSESKNADVVKSVLWAIDKESGVTASRVDMLGGSGFFLFRDDKNIYVVNDTRIEVFNGELVKSSAEYVFNKKLVGEPLFDSERGNLYLVFGDEITKVGIEKGKLVYEKIIDIKKGNPINVFTIFNDTYFIGDSAGNLYAYNKSDKKQIWKFRAGGKISDIKMFADKMVVSSFDNFIYCLDNTDGKRIWKKRFPGRISEVEKSTVDNFFVRSTYSPEYYLIDVLSGDVTEQYSPPMNLEAWEFKLQTALRLIIITKSNSIDIYKNN